MDVQSVRAGACAIMTSDYSFDTTLAYWSALGICMLAVCGTCGVQSEAATVALLHFPDSTLDILFSSEEKTAQATASCIASNSEFWKARTQV
jgi:hypothetical protein